MKLVRFLQTGYISIINNLLKKPIASMVLPYPSFSKYKLHFLQRPVGVYLVEWITHYTIMSYIVWSSISTKIRLRITRLHYIKIWSVYVLYFTVNGRLCTIFLHRGNSNPDLLLLHSLSRKAKKVYSCSQT